MSYLFPLSRQEVPVQVSVPIHPSGAVSVTSWSWGALRCAAVYIGFGDMRHTLLNIKGSVHIFKNVHGSFYLRR